MTVKLHTFRWPKDVPHLKIKAGWVVGHLYSDVEDLDELRDFGREIGIKDSWLQILKTPIHYDLWGDLLDKAMDRLYSVGDQEFRDDMRGLKT